ncbi:preprotein translocase subunit SecY [Hydrogenibacillus schlegelii]|uniref:Protein translocase subunit SecY n=1 Tax=Hydrogenibacillus schlegelii TaxID=1484 RepID=A0A132N3K0_HYDSH|nr:preprotein translocase subunit SecY [Hydrogenibacillus schlegelii]KWX04607.1 preprotein translocase subunit SecY [Hydrogenibacillus schlegelii]MBT9283178.1 preprotein translocase subunit SecY [Hydrogenibacillus schlegelii]OAR04435.1 preprotein translocase subunit SecY [Hydrogenibacillus schlegelii]
MFKAVRNIFSVADLRRRVLYTLMMLVVFRIGSFIPVPGIDVEALRQGIMNSNLFGLFDTFSGRAMSNFSIFTLGIMPYITASIIMQLLSMDVVPKLAEWAKEGESGRRKIAQVTRYATVVLAFIQAVGMSIAFERQYHMIVHPTFFTYVVIAVVLTAGTTFLMWMGEQITEKGVGNGISILIFAGIVAAIPSSLEQIYVTKFTGEGANLFLAGIIALIVLAIVVAIIAGVVFVQQGVRKIPVQYAKRVVGRRVVGGQSTHIPLRVNSAGVIPVIFAVSIVYFPQIIAQFFRGNAFADWVLEQFTVTAPLGMFLYVLLIIAFSFFYTYVQLNPQQLTENLQKHGGFIPGIRPGRQTYIYLTRVINRITLFGALFLAAVAILPVFFTDVFGLPPSVRIGGTSLLIVVGVALETMKQIESQLIKRHYEGFIRR